MSPSKPSQIGLKEILLLAGGGVAFLLVNVYLFLDRCTTNEFMVNCRAGTGEAWAFGAVTVALLGIAAIVTRAGRFFAIGFASAFLAVTVVSTGSCATPWLDPYYAAKHRFDQQPWRAAKLRRDAQHRIWVEKMSTRAMDVARGVDMAGAIAECATSRAGANGKAPDAATVAEACDQLRDFQADLDPADGVRDVIPDVPPSGASEFVIDQRNGDAGWRWTYKRTADGFIVEVKPDDALPHGWPRVTASPDGRVMVMVVPDAAPFEVAPIADLKQLATCLRRIPEMAKRLPDGSRVEPTGWFLTGMANHLCGMLRPRLTEPVPNDAHTTLFGVMMIRSALAEGVGRLATYRVQFVRRVAADNAFAFDLKATPLTRGLPRYLVTFEGVVHRTMEARDAIISDAVVAK